MPNIAAYMQLDGHPAYDPDFCREQAAALNESAICGIDLSRLDRVNQFVFPRGFETGRGYLLMAGKEVAELNENVATHTLVIQGQNTVTFSKLTIASIEPFTGAGELTDETLYIVELVDLRIFGQLTSVDKAYNVFNIDESAFYAATRNAGADWTYTTLIQNLWSNVPSAFGSLGVSAVDFIGTPTNYVFRGVSVFDALKTVLDDQQHILTLSPSGDFAVVPAFTSLSATADEMENAEDYLLSGADNAESSYPRMPATIRVFFPKRDKAFQTNTDPLVLVAKDHWQVNPVYTVDVASGATALAGTVLAIHDSMPALYSELGVISNAAALAAQASARATRTVNAISIADQESLRRYTGAHTFTLGPQIACVAYRDVGDGLITEVRGTYRNRRSSPITNRNLIAEQSEPTLAAENNNGPHLTQWHLEPERMIVGKVTAVSGASGTVRVQFGTNTSGTVITWADTGLPHSITVYEIGNEPFPPVDTILIAHFHHQTERWVTDSSKDALIIFKLTENLPIGEDAAAVIRTFNGTAYSDGTAIRVFDFYGLTTQTPGFVRGMWCGITGMEGLARRRDVSSSPPENQYEVVWMEQFARFCQVTLTSKFTGADFTAQSTTDYTFGQGDAPPLDSQSELRVHDDQDMFPRANVDAKACVVRNEYLKPDEPQNPWYTVFNCQQEAIYGEASLSGTLCPEDGEGSISNFEPRSPSLYNLQPDPEPATAANLYKLSGQNGAKVFVVFFNPTEAELDQDPDSEGYWVIVQVEHEIFQVVTQMRWDDGYKCIQYKYLEKVALMTCSQESEWTDVLCFEECP